MAIPENENHQLFNSGPKKFTEYSFSAILALLGLVGSFLVIASQFSIVAIMIPILLLSTPNPQLVILAVAIISLVLMIIPGVGQVYYAYQLHVRSFEDFNRVVQLSSINIILSITGLVAFWIVLWILAVLYIQIIGAVIVFNLLAIFMLRKPEVQNEFR